MHDHLPNRRLIRRATTAAANVAHGALQLIVGTVALLVVLDAIVSSGPRRRNGSRRGPTHVSAIPITSHRGERSAHDSSGPRTRVPWQLTLFAGLAPVLLTAGMIIWQRVRSLDERFSFELPGMAGTLQWLIIGTVGGVVLGIVAFRWVATHQGIANDHR